MKVQIVYRKNIVIVKLTGDFTMYTVEKLRKDLKNIKERDIFAVNFQAVESIDSTAIGFLVKLFQKTKKFVLFGMTDGIRDIFDKTKIDKFMTIFTIDEFAKKYPSYQEDS